MVKNKVVVDFKIVGYDDISHETISQLTGIEPIKVFIKGNPRNPNNPDSPLIKFNGWIMNAKLHEDASFEQQMNCLLDIIELRLTVFKQLCSSYYTEFSCAIYTYSASEKSTPSVHLSKRYHKLAADLNFEFDVDLYAW